MRHLIVAAVLASAPWPMASGDELATRLAPHLGTTLDLVELGTGRRLVRPTLEGMVETLVARGRLRAIAFDDAGCTACPVKSGCFIMNDGAAKTYVLAPDAGTVPVARAASP